MIDSAIVNVTKNHPHAFQRLELACPIVYKNNGTFSTTKNHHCFMSRSSTLSHRGHQVPICLVARWVDVNKALYPRLTGWYAPLRPRNFDWHYLSHHMFFGCIFNPSWICQYQSHLHEKSSSDWTKKKRYLPPHPRHWMQRVKDELKTLNVRDWLWWHGFLDMALAEIPLGDGVGVG